jgi:DNA adenine methylase
MALANSSRFGSELLPSFNQKMQTLTERKQLLRAPFPWFGGKALASELIWSHVGSDIGNYIEPFFGSGAVLLNAPECLNFASTINDLDGYICNFWRSVAFDPAEVAKQANSQVNEIDLQARHQWLVDNRVELTEKLKADPDYCCTKSAGWWAWGCCCWIGSGWCADKKGVNRQLPHLGDKGNGVNRQLPHLGDKGKGVNRHDDREIWLTEWIETLQIKVRESRITCGDWNRICSVGTMTRFGKCAVLLDPPYGTTKAVYARDSTDVATEVLEWCVANGDNPKLKIALCGHVGQHDRLESLGWTVESPKVRGGYQGAEDRERIWFSPGCDRLSGQTMLDFSR